MHRVVRSNKYLINRNVDYEKAVEFNKLNENFKSEYSRASFFDRVILRKNLLFIMNPRENIVGYFWLNNHKDSNTKIKSLFLDSVDKKTMFVLSDYLDNFKEIEYISSINAKCNNLLSELGFERDQSIIDMQIELKQYPEQKYENYIIRPFRRRKDEWNRVEVQNSIFYKKNRTPLTVSDIELDMMQEYYLNNGSYFLTNHGKVIGYGQLILMKGELYLVNFGILHSYRNKGLGKYFLKYLLNKGHAWGYEKMKIKVLNDNDIALKLYSGIGFKKTSDTIYWKRK
ncbi:GNAT family N-acetyltransferase [Oceanirhabdus sp. W0125-5]|uniref:GNAT family N-acetyltransferase n=1 Tax=Oceanirhabdus sp. W0125-5 TaxID=2999116 RepID=UPI0022F342C3|nr:GNAT family N-acetyltransferase [Oceanirhabdus sp. W0125-5]WBW95103.1 GNAT family N-acetyltransferase [Oceanirhabdus sp. W0125-5]